MKVKEQREFEGFDLIKNDLGVMRVIVLVLILINEFLITYIELQLSSSRWSLVVAVWSVVAVCSAQNSRYCSTAGCPGGRPPGRPVGRPVRHPVGRPVSSSGLSACSSKF